VTAGRWPAEEGRADHETPPIDACTHLPACQPAYLPALTLVRKETRRRSLESLVPSIGIAVAHRRFEAIKPSTWMMMMIIIIIQGICRPNTIRAELAARRIPDPSSPPFIPFRHGWLPCRLFSIILVLLSLPKKIPRGRPRCAGLGPTWAPRNGEALPIGLSYP
jgi:hypothetical protein